jgi:Flp pilus assembly protein TadB
LFEKGERDKAERDTTRFQEAEREREQREEAAAEREQARVTARKTAKVTRERKVQEQKRAAGVASDRFALLLCLAMLCYAMQWSNVLCWAFHDVT